MELVSSPSLPNPTLISTANIVTPAAWSQTPTNRRFDYYNGVPPLPPLTTGRYRTGNTSLTHTPNPAPHNDNVVVGGTPIYVREWVTYNGVDYYADSLVGRVVQPATPVPTGYFARLDPDIPIPQQGSSSFPGVICANTITGNNNEVACGSIPDPGGLVWTDSQQRFWRGTSNDGYPILALAHEANDPEHAGAPRAEVHWWAPSASASLTSPNWYTGGGSTVLFPFNDAAPVELWVGWCVRFVDRLNSDANKLIFQCHQSGPTVNPFLGLLLAGSRLQLSQRYNANASPTQATNVVYQDSSYILPSANTWLSIVQRIRFGYSLGGSPSYEMWINSTKIYERTGTNGRCGYNQSNQRFMRISQYPFDGMPANSRRVQETRGFHALVGAYSEQFMRNLCEGGS